MYQIVIRDPISLKTYRCRLSEIYSSYEEAQRELVVFQPLVLQKLEIEELKVSSKSFLFSLLNKYRDDAFEPPFTIIMQGRKFRFNLRLSNLTTLPMNETTINIITIEELLVNLALAHSVEVIDALTNKNKFLIVKHSRWKLNGFQKYYVEIFIYERDKYEEITSPQELYPCN